MAFITSLVNAEEEQEQEQEVCVCVFLTNINIYCYYSHNREVAISKYGLGLITFIVRYLIYSYGLNSSSQQCERDH